MDHPKRRTPQRVVPPRAPALRPGPAGGARDENRRRRTQALCESALQLYLEQGIDAVSIDNIARAAGVGKASFYSYFSDQEQLMATLLEPFRGRALAAMDECQARIERARRFEEFRHAQERMATELLAAFMDNLGVLRLVLQEAHAPARGARRPIRALYDAIVERAVAHNEAALRAGLIRDVHPRVVAFINLGAIERLAVGFLEGADLGDLPAAVRGLAEVMLAGLRRPARR